MKTRMFFVSNSSSSSFVIIGNKTPTKREVNAWDGLYINAKLAKGEFGWGPERITRWEERLAFAYIQAVYSKNDKWIAMFDTVVREYTGADKIIYPYKVVSDNEHPVKYNNVAELTLPTINEYGSTWYIDHQSSAIEDKNTEIFNDEDTLARFIFSDDSYIQLDNDNH